MYGEKYPIRPLSRTLKVMSPFTSFDNRSLGHYWLFVEICNKGNRSSQGDHKGKADHIKIRSQLSRRDNSQKKMPQKKLDLVRGTGLVD